jgi:hypothetical protein
VFLVNGQTRSKFYSSQRFIDDQRHCVSGSAYRVCMILNQYESSSGGPFHRYVFFVSISEPPLISTEISIPTTEATTTPSIGTW